MKRMKATNIHFTERQTRLLKEAATATGLSVAEIVRRAIDAWLDATRRVWSGAGPDDGRRGPGGP